MNLCSGDKNHTHDEVCYEARHCPVCEAMDAAQAVEKELNDTIDQLKKEIETMERDAKDPIIAASKLGGET